MAAFAEIRGFFRSLLDISFMGMADLQQSAAAVILEDPDVSTVGAAIGVGSSSSINTGRIFISLKPWKERKLPEAQVIQRLRPELVQVPGITTFLQPLETSGSGAAEPHRVSVHAAGRRHSRAPGVGAEARSQAQEPCGPAGHRQRSRGHEPAIDDPHQLRPRLPPRR